MRSITLLAAAAAAALTIPAAQAAEQAAGKFPEKPVRLVIGSAPGSGPDIISRAVADRLYDAWGQRIVVDSRPGVAGIISAELVLRSIPDGYTWMMLTSQLLVATNVYPNVKFDLSKDFKSISLIGTVPFTLVVNPDVPAKTVAELIEVAKKQQIRYGSAGTGASEHLSGVLFNTLTKTEMLHVPYKGVAEAMAAAISNEVNMAYGVLPAVLPHIQSGRLRAVAVTTPKRSSAAPDIPTIGETVPGYSMMGWYSIVAPKGTPEAIMNKASAEIQKAVKDRQFAELLRKIGVDAVGSTRAELDAFRRDQTKLIRQIVKVAGVTSK